MGSYRITRRVEAAPEQVYRAFTDPVLIADWMDASAVLDASGPLDVSGTRFTLVIRGPHRFRSEVVRAEPGHVHETTGRGPFGSYRMVATLAPSNGATQLDLLTEYSLPFRAIGRWVDRRWIDREPRTIANREVDRLVSLVSEPSSVDAEDAREGPRGQPDLDALVARAQTAHLDRELDGWSTRSVTWSGGETQVIEAGAGEPLLLVHGGMGNAADWASLMNRLATSRRVIAVDRPGHGLATPFDYRGVDLWRHAGGFLREVLDGLGLETVDVAGNSMGGMWSIALAEAHPERVRHLILIGAPAGSKRSIPMKVGVLAWPVAGLLIAKMI
ncbi:MAG: alpha/beta fold hydrolase, partial [Chloroflexota bacterium]